jgi:diguanylate cyclase (GGDEF)-like protein
VRTVNPRKRSISGPNRTRLMLALAVVVICGAVWEISQAQRNTAERVFEQSQAADQMLTAMLDQETGLRGYAISRNEAFLEPYIRGTDQFDRAVADLRRLVKGKGQQDTIFSIVQAARRWQDLAEEGIGEVREAGKLSRSSIFERKRIFDNFRRQSTIFGAELTRERKRELDRAGTFSIFVILALGLLFLGFGYVLIERQTRAVRARRDRGREYRRIQAEFAGTMQVMRDEPEAHSLVKHHLERSIAGSEVLVLNRNNSDNRLMAATTMDTLPELEEKLVEADPESCLAVRLGRAYEQGEGIDPLLRCELCGSLAAEVVCTPSLVGGEVIGSVIVTGETPLDAEARNRISDSVSQAAPVLANLRNLAIAENRAATDALTGLPNARSCRDNLKRMTAHAGRSVSPLSAVSLDLDHFKQVNDRYGHGAGDDVLAAVGEAVRATLRGSDFGGRFGGEEFLLLLPATDQHGALQLAEKVRKAIEALEFQQPELKVTASFGIATYPLDALDGDGLLRMSDRALYLAKSKGRNRVELVEAGHSPLPEPTEVSPSPEP